MPIGKGLPKGDLLIDGRSRGVAGGGGGGGGGRRGGSNSPHTPRSVRDTPGGGNGVGNGSGASPSLPPMSPLTTTDGTPESSARVRAHVHTTVRKTKNGQKESVQTSI